MQAGKNNQLENTDQGQNFSPGRLFGNVGCLLAAIVLLMGLLPVSARAVSAQNVDIILVQPPNIENFPIISAEFKLYQGPGELILDLQSEHLTVFENERQVSIASVKKSYRGVHFTLAIEGGRELDLRDAVGVSPFEKLAVELIEWGTTRDFKGHDTWSLVTTDDIGVRNTRDAKVWVAALRDYQPDFRSIEPTLASLESAIQQAREWVVPFGVDKALLYITPPPAPDDINRINVLAEEARQDGIRVNIWMVGDGYFLTNQQGGSLVAMTETTGGQFFHFTGVEDLPDPDEYISHLGSTHTLAYESNIRQTGTYSLRIEVNHQNQQITGESVPFLINLQPPNPILISPPANITRRVMAESDDFVDSLEPRDYSVKFLVEFPDHHLRTLVASRLYIDGIIVDVREVPPFEVLNWDLTSLTEPGVHTIQVEVEDSLGLSGKTILTPVQIKLVMPEPETTLGAGQIGLTAASLVVGASLIVLSVWLFRRQWKPVALPQVPSEVFGTGWPASSNHPINTKPERKPFAVLYALRDPFEGGDPTLTLIDHSPVTVGRDPSQASLLIDAAGLDEIQARLWRQNGTIWLADLESEKGTWVNYELVGTEPVQIQSGDLIHFGDVGFRLTINHRPVSTEVTLSNYEPIL